MVTRSSPSSACTDVSSTSGAPGPAHDSKASSSTSSSMIGSAMRSSLISLSLCLSTISACGGDDSCGTKGASPNGVAVGDGAAITLMYGGLTSSPNNDCPGSSTSVVSLTVTGTQTNGTGFITLCF